LEAVRYLQKQTPHGTWRLRRWLLVEAHNT
jgi:hypothetical protein